MSNLSYNVLIPTKDLKPHPINTEIYGEENIDPILLQNIKDHGVLVPLLVTSDNKIVSGHRRWKHAKEIGIEKIACQVFNSTDELEQLKVLLSSNMQRDKTETQYQKEADKWEWIFETENLEKQKESGILGAEFGSLGGRGNKREDGKPPVPTLAHRVFNPSEPEKRDFTDTTREKLPKQVGYSRGKTTFSKVRTVYNAAKNGDETAQQLMDELDTKKTTPNKAYNELKKKEEFEKRKESLKEKSAAVASLPETITLHNADFLTDYTILGAESIDCIITDPPYVREWLDNHEAFAKAAQYVLKPGGFLITYIGHIHMDSILRQMTPYLDYYWIMCLKHAGSSKAVHSRMVMCGMKPILVFQNKSGGKPKQYFNDLIEGTGREKDAHEWQQGEEELSGIFNSFTDPGDIILDPFMGSGTTISMAKKLNRVAIGFDINPENIDLVKGRVGS